MRNEKQAKRILFLDPNRNRCIVKLGTNGQQIQFRQANCRRLCEYRGEGGNRNIPHDFGISIGEQVNCETQHQAYLQGVQLLMSTLQALEQAIMQGNQQAVQQLQAAADTIATANTQLLQAWLDCEAS